MLHNAIIQFLKEKLGKKYIAAAGIILLLIGEKVEAAAWTEMWKFIGGFIFYLGIGFLIAAIALFLREHYGQKSEEKFEKIVQRGFLVKMLFLPIVLTIVILIFIFVSEFSK